MTPFLSYRGTIYPWQCDHIGHMNVMWYVGKFDEASWNFLAQFGLTPSYLRDQQRGLAAVQQNLSYKSEMVAGDIVEVYSHMVEMKPKVIRFIHEMRNGESKETAAICEITAVHLDRTARKACEFPAEIRAAAEQFRAPQPC